MAESPVETAARARASIQDLMKSVSAGSKTTQTIGIEWADYLKVSFEQAADAAGQLARAGSPARAIEIQGAFVKASGDQMMARAATLRGLYATLAQDMVKPFAGLGLPKSA